MASPKEIKYRYISPIVAPNMFTVNIKRDGSSDVLFANAVEEDAVNVKADVIAAVRLANLDALKNLKKVIESTIKEHEEREP